MARRIVMRQRATAVVVLLALVGCPAETPTPEPTPLAPPKGGSITVAYPAQPPTLHPFAVGAWSNATRDILSLMLPSFWTTDPDDVSQPSLLSREPVVDGTAPTTVVVDIRDDASWSDGTPITVDDLIGTHRLAVAAPKAAWRRDPFDRIESIEALTPKRARITFTAPFARWRSIFPVVLPVHALATKKQRAKLTSGKIPSGGPFMLDRWRRGRDMRFVRNPRAGARRPELDEVRIVFVPDTPGALALLKRGTVDAIAAYHGADLARRGSRIPDATVVGDAGETWIGLVLNTDRVSTAVRRAVALALDRERIATTLITDGARVDEFPGARGESLDPDGDTARARDLLDRAGWKGSPFRRRGGVDLVVDITFDGDDELLGILAQAVQQQLAGVGIAVDLDGIDAEVLAKDVWPSGESAATLTALRPAAWRALATGPARLGGKRITMALTRADRTGDTDRLADELERQMPVVPIGIPQVSVIAVDIEQVRVTSASPFWNVQQWRRR